MNLSLTGSGSQKIYCNRNLYKSIVYLSHFECLQKIFTNQLPFFKDKIQGWLHFKYFPPESIDAILQQMTRFNSNIFINWLHIWWEHFVEKNILFINDINDLKCNIYSYKTFCELLGALCLKFIYHQPVDAIPLVWRKKVKNAERKVLVRKLFY